MSNIYYWFDALWNSGFFVTFQSVVGFLNFCELNPIAGKKVYLEKGLYFDSTVGNNWWEYYFEPIESGSYNQTTPIEHIGDMLKSHWCTEAISTMTRDRAAELIARYIKLKPFLQNKLDQFIKENFNEDYVIGLHFRGSDKSSEAPRIPYEKFVESINKHTKNLIKPFKIFAASDEQAFINYIKSQFGDKVCHINAIRSLNHEPIHHKGGYPMNNPYKLGEDAVLDCYLLAKTDILIRTQSNLSSSAANINPKLPVIDLNKAHYRVGLR